MLARVLKKGQVVIPKELRKKTGISPGDKVEITASEDGLVIIPMRINYTENTRGIVRGRLSLDELEDISTHEQ
jgi:AbrB family looped-hinge helix DNA binding protein